LDGEAATADASVGGQEIPVFRVFFWNKELLNYYIEWSLKATRKDILVDGWMIVWRYLGGRLNDSMREI
jgi:hypothetical protein